MMASTLRKTPKRRKSPPRLVRQLKSGAWEVLGDQPPLPVYESREAALRATDLTANERLKAGVIAAARPGRERVVLYWDVMSVIAARGQGWADA
jgi:hypothetical protein